MGPGRKKVSKGQDPMRHISLISVRRPPAAADELTFLSTIISLLSSVVGLLGEISTVFGISLDLSKKGGSQT